MDKKRACPEALSEAGGHIDAEIDGALNFLRFHTVWAELRPLDEYHANIPHCTGANQHQLR
ncbi:hypothetical protein [Propionivibrio sp.]|uniref:hypothetical protein n=1 Tax=Propionivibrio sp. TaxID=2212460 RepID=UPI0025D22BD4|nr:hypothetical protein [Propionivibrio sp.]MBK8745158.1 hypothetical protein [Propionivibrio sp.]